MKTYFTSDTHFHHKNILNFTDRPYKDLNEMHEGLIKAHNKVVNKNDVVYMLGDFSFGNHKEWISILNELRGKIILIKGNHDKTKVINRVLKEGYLDKIHSVGTALRIDGFTLNLTHYPLEVGNRPRNFSIHGHLHENSSRMLNQINIGVDSHLAKSLNNPFGTPISTDDLVQHLREVNPKVEREFILERVLERNKLN